MSLVVAVRLAVAAFALLFAICLMVGAVEPTGQIVALAFVWIASLSFNSAADHLAATKENNHD